MVCLWERAVVTFYNPMLCEQNSVRRWSCTGAASLRCLGQSPQILWGRNEKQSPSWDHCWGVEGQLNTALLLFWSRERSPRAGGKQEKPKGWRNAGPWALLPLYRKKGLGGMVWHCCGPIWMWGLEINYSLRAAGNLLGWLILPKNMHSFLNISLHKGRGGSAAILDYPNETQF